MKAILEIPLPMELLCSNPAGVSNRRRLARSRIDAPIEGVAGQEVQNMNLMYGWGREDGLR